MKSSKQTEENWSKRTRFDQAIDSSHSYCYGTTDALPDYDFQSPHYSAAS